MSDAFDKHKGSFEIPTAPSVRDAPDIKKGRPKTNLMGPAPLATPGETGVPEHFLGEPADIYTADMDENHAFKYLPAAFQEAIALMTNADWAKSYQQVMREANPTEIDFKIRRSLWAALENSKKFLVPIEWKKVYDGICTYAQFYAYPKKPAKLRFLLEPPAVYNESLATLMDIGLARLREIISMPLEDKNGKVNPLLVEKVIKCIVLVDHRIHGGYTQRAEIKAQQLSAHIDIKKVQSIEEIDAKLAELEKKAEGTTTVTVIEQKEPMINILNQLTGTSADSKRDLEKLGIEAREEGAPFGDASLKY